MIYEVGTLRIDTGQRTVYRNGRLIPLTDREFDILNELVKSPGTPVGNDMLIAAVWGKNQGSKESLRQQIHGLRQKLGRRHIANMPNRGYYLVIEAQAPRASAQLPTVERSAEPRRFPFGWLVGGAAVLALVAAGLAVRRSPHPATPPPAIRGRLLARATSEGGVMEWIALPIRPTYLAAALHDRRVFATVMSVPKLFIVDPSSHSVREVTLPRDAGPIAIAPDGKLYIGSSVDGVMILETASAEPSQPAEISTGGPIRGMALTPDGEKLFLAMGRSGVKRLSTRTLQLTRITDAVCPQNVALSPHGGRLYVAYQCSGPTGQRGHDPIEVFDTGSESSIGIVQGLPMTGSEPALSPDGNLLVLNAGDACSNPSYDHEGCPSYPARVFHVLGTAERSLRRSVPVPPSTPVPGLEEAPSRFLDNTRFFLSGRWLAVFDTTAYQNVERLYLGGQDAGVLALAPAGNRVYVGTVNPPGLYVIEPENADCEPPQAGLALAHTVDGTFTDSAGFETLVPRGAVRFTPGRVGQAVYLDGASYLERPWGVQTVNPSQHDLTLSLYMKGAEPAGRGVLADWSTEEPHRTGLQLRISGDGHFEFQSWPAGAVLRSKTAATAAAWRHLVVTKSAGAAVLYVNGVEEDRGSPSSSYTLLDQRLYVGAEHGGRSAIHGSIDEFLVWNRALTAKEAADLFRLREAGPCKL